MTTKSLKNLFEIVFASFFLLILCYSVSESANRNVLFFPVFLAGLFGAYKLINKPSVKNESDDRRWERRYRFVWIAGFIMSVCFAFFLETEFTWDWGWVVKSSAQYVLDGTEPNTAYFAMYPNNLFITSIIIAFFKIIHTIYPDASVTTLKNASMLLSCVLIQVAITFIYLTAKEIWGSKKAFFAGLLTLAYTPLFMYAQYAYSDTLAIPFSAAVSYLFIRIIKTDSVKKNLIYCTLIGLCVGIGGKLKFMVFIILIAGIITLFFTNNQWNDVLKKLLYSAVSTVAALAVFSLCSLAINPVFDYDEATLDRYEFPPQQWIMMMLNETGGYNRDDVEFSKQFETYDEKKAAAQEEIKNRVVEMGVTKLLNHIFCTKLKRTWADPTLAAGDYVRRDSMHEDGFMRNFFGYGGKYTGLFDVYIETLHCLIITALVYSAVKMRSDEQYTPEIFLMQLSLFGILLFLSIWECNSRYLYIFIPQLLIPALYAIIKPEVKADVIDSSKTKKRKNKQTKKR